MERFNITKAIEEETGKEDKNESDKPLNPQEFKKTRTVNPPKPPSVSERLQQLKRRRGSDEQRAA